MKLLNWLNDEFYDGIKDVSTDSNSTANEFGIGGELYHLGIVLVPSIRSLSLILGRCSFANHILLLISAHISIPVDLGSTIDFVDQVGNVLVNGRFGEDVDSMHIDVGFKELFGI